MASTYRFLYAIGFTPWERMGREQPVVDQIEALFAREEQGRERPFGRALDLGCGSGIWSVKLAQRGWDVTGLDFVPKALRRAADRARATGVDVALVQGDVTRLEDANIGAGFVLMLDFGVFHDELSDEQRIAMAGRVTAVADVGTTLLMIACQPGRRGPLPRGASRADIEGAYRGWSITDEEPMDVSAAPRMVRRAAPRLFRLRREPQYP